MVIKPSLCFIVLFLTCICVVRPQEKRYSLKQVVILSRHGLRTPLSKNLAEMTPKRWPAWKEKPGYLTAKGKVLEGFMGSFFSAWLKEEGLLSNDCPTEDSFYVYANIKQRTRASALAFVSEAFPGCNVTINHSNSDTDPIFNPVIHNTSSEFRQMALKEMQAQLQNLSLNDSYVDLEQILDFKNSEICKNKHICNLESDKNEAYVTFGEKPNISGPIKIGTSVIDAFEMQYYEGFTLQNVAWGYLETSKEWQTMTRLRRSYHNIIFNTSLIAKDIAKPLIEFMTSFFLDDSVPKVTLLMGHDANMYTVLRSLDFKPYKLPNQYELCPVSGKIVFQKWFDNVKKVNLLKINYVYQTNTQLRETKALRLQDPPQFALLELNQCKVDDNGFCLWNDFVEILHKFCSQLPYNDTNKDC